MYYFYFVLVLLLSVFEINFIFIFYLLDYFIIFNLVLFYFIKMKFRNLCFLVISLRKKKEFYIIKW